MIRVLCYSNDMKLRPILGPALGPGYELTLESNQAALKQTIADGRPDVVILDFDSSYGSLEDGFEVFDSVVKSHIPVVVMTDDARRSATLEMIQLGAYDFFRKPFSLMELRVVLGRAYERVALKRELEGAKTKLQAVSACDRLIGSSPPTQVVYNQIRRVANLNAPVLIRGESGTGKELIAQAIHRLGKRAKEPFVAVPCGAIPETLIEAELFGHEKGAFTGTTGAREGYLEQAGEGTLLLDEIGELSLQTQVKLLRVLQQREFCRLGSCKLIPLRARILAATHRGLEQMVETGTFRVDLMFRLNVLTIEAPPLRERAEDIPVLARHFLLEAAAAFDEPVREISPAAMELLLAYRWPGNVRELENAMQFALMHVQGETISSESLPPSVQQAVPRPAGEPEEPLSFEDQLREYKIELAMKALTDSNGNKTVAARSLQISRAYLHRLIRVSPKRSSAA
jgi:DNA-binding NtrC family response regulator